MTPSKLERRLAWRRRILLGGWLMASAVLLGRAVELQVLEGAAWREAAEGQHRKTAEIPAPRGTIYDRDGVPLALSRETWKVAVAPREVEDLDALRGLLQETLGISAARARRVTDPERRWAPLPGVYEPSVKKALEGVRGVHLSRELRRDYPHGDLALGVLGRVIDGAGTGGIEQAFDSILRGRPGREVVARDSEGREIPGQVFELERPVAGGDVTLTLDADLQEIAQQALQEAIDSTRARGGDLLVTDPRTGEILAMVSINRSGNDALSVINAPYEPGSTLKPFTIAAVLQHDRGSLNDTVDVGQGYWVVNRRVLRDVHGSGRMSVGDALRTSSNVGIAKAALPLTPREQYESLRDFGFGLPSGLPLPGEGAGRLRRPEDWSIQSPQSLAIGYEIAVTPVQMAMAYGALANGGRLMEARLIRSLREAGGAERSFEPRVIRRVVRDDVVDRIGRVLMDVVEDGTGTAAQLETFRVAGKSGTARAYKAGGGYESGRYFSSFVGYFPADDPQLVIFVKLDGAQGQYYGGATAAPVTRMTMEAALAARQSPLDRSKLLGVVRAARRPRQAEQAPAPLVRFATLEERWAAVDTLAPAPEPPLVEAEPQPVPVPDVKGLPPRLAVRRLHALGLRVEWGDDGPIVGTEPAAGARLMPGDTVRLRTGRGFR